MCSVKVCIIYIHFFLKTSSLTSLRLNGGRKTVAMVVGCDVCCLIHEVVKTELPVLREEAKLY